ncbi:uncharacterized protein V1516DRAFT_674986 [Lipomyces oligophaga]|uniref:uncharacterized protein n=1 Tax=Lipomyces oligophaga TaxID=45792 RepID=UPI0034CF5E65
MASLANGSAPQVRMISDRILCVADIRGNLTILNQLAKELNATAIIHTGDFGFYDRESVTKITDKTLRHVAQYSPLLDLRSLPFDAAQLRQYLTTRPISQLAQFLSGDFKLDVPVYTVHGACEDVSVLEKFRSGEYKVPNLFVVDEHSTYCIETANDVKLRLLGLGGALVMHKLFDNGSGRTTIAGGGGTSWTTFLQIGELIDTAARVYDESETRILITHASPTREGILSQLAMTLKADFSISGGLHFRNGSSYNEFSVNPAYENFRSKLVASRAQFMDVWDVVKSEVYPIIADNVLQKQFIDNALGVIMKMPTADQTSEQKERDEAENTSFRRLWHLNLADVSYGSTVLDINDSKIGIEMKSEGFSFKYRKPGFSTPSLPTGPKMKSSQAPARRGAPTANGGAALSYSQVTQSSDAGSKSSEGLTSFKSASKSDNHTTVSAASGASSSPESYETTKASEDNTSSGKYGANISTSSSSKESREVRRPGLWVSNGDESEDTIKSHFANEDQSSITGVTIKTSHTGKKYAIVYFDTQDNALAALGRADRTSLVKVTPLLDNPSRSTTRGTASRLSGWTGAAADSAQATGGVTVRRGPRISGGSRTLAHRGGRGGRGGSYSSHGANGVSSGDGPSMSAESGGESGRKSGSISEGGSSESKQVVNAPTSSTSETTKTST